MLTTRNSHINRVIALSLSLVVGSIVASPAALAQVHHADRTREHHAKHERARHRKKAKAKKARASAGASNQGSKHTVVTGTTPVFSGTTPVLTGTTPVVTGTTPVVTGTTPVVTGTTPVVTGTTLFSGSAVTGWLNQSANASRVTVVQDPDAASDSVLQFNVFNSDIAPLTPTGNPRAQLITHNGVVTQNQPFWESYEVYIPASFPTSLTYNSWIALGSPFYGAPWNGSPSVELQIENGDFIWRTNAYSQKPGSILWQSPVVTNQWVRFTWYVNPAIDGFAELYVNGQPLTVTYNGHTGAGVDIPVIDATNDTGPWESQLSVYMEHNVFSELTMYFKNFTIATTQALAQKS
jgi:Polysaccharide lyase